MSDELPRWGQQAPDALRDAIAGYRQRGQAERVERLLAATEARADNAASKEGGPTATTGRLARLVGPTAAGVLLLAVGWLALPGVAPTPHNKAVRTRSLAPVTVNANPPRPGSALVPPRELEDRSEPHAAAVPEPPSATSAKGGRRRQKARAASDATQELRLLKRARVHLPRDPAGCLRLLREHRARFPQGVFSQEREVLAVEALLHAGRPAQARRRANRFARRHPDSAHLRRVDTLLGQSPATGGQ